MDELLTGLSNVTGLASLATLAWKFVDGAASSALSDGVKNFFGKKVRSLTDAKALRENHDLLKALRRAMLEATAEWLRACQPDLEAAPGLVEHLKEWLAREHRLLNAPDAVAAYSVPAYEAVERLLSREPGGDAWDDLGRRTKEAWLIEMATDLPPAARATFLNGWPDGKGGRWDWFAIVGYYFANVLPLKGMETAQDKFRNLMAAETRTDVRAILQRLEALATERGIPDVAWLREGLNALREDLTAVREGVERLEEGQQQQNARDEQRHRELLAEFQKLTAQHPEKQQEIEMLRQQLLSSNVELKEERKMREAVEEKLAAATGEPLKQQAAQAVERRDYDGAEQLLQESLRKRKQEEADDYYQLGQVRELNLKYREALEAYKQAAALDAHPAHLINAGNLSQQLGQLSDALGYHEGAREQCEADHGERHPVVATCHNNIGVVYQNQGKLDEALDSFAKALSIYRDVYGERHPQVADCHNNIGVVYQNQGKLDEALDSYEKALSIYREVYGERHPVVATCHNNIGIVYQNQGKLDEALDSFAKALSIRLSVYGERHPQVASASQNIAIALYLLGRKSEALEQAVRAYTIFQAVYGEEHPRTRKARNTAAKMVSEPGEAT